MDAVYLVIFLQKYNGVEHTEDTEWQKTSGLWHKSGLRSSYIFLYMGVLYFSCSLSSLLVSTDEEN